MDLSLLLTVPVIAAATVLVIMSVWVGFAVGKSREVARKEAALADAEMARKVSLNEMRAHHERKLDGLIMANADQMDHLKQTHSGELERMGSEHAELIRRLNDSNNANINALKQDQERQTAELERRYTTEIEQLRKDHAEAVRALAAEHLAAMEALQGEHQERVQRMRDEHTRLEVERDSLVQSVAELNQTVTDLHNRIKEARLNNRLSVSKSGEKLIRVVRSVQELATELDETSRAVTDGEYSFFAEIKDMRDKETVLSLTGGDRAHTPEPPQADEPESESGVPQAQELAGADALEADTAATAETGSAVEDDTTTGEETQPQTEAARG